MARNDNRPNVLIFITDQLRCDHLGCMGNAVVRTPHIDRLSETGVTFERAYVANPLCMPARATLFTGRTPRGHGVRTNGIPLSPDIPTMPEALRQAGYATKSIGKLHLTPFRMPEGIRCEDDSPADFPESREMWDSGVLNELPSPYYGFESANFLGGHSGQAFGEYLNWLEAQGGGRRDSLRPPHPDPREWNSAIYRMDIPEHLHYNRWISDRAISFLDRQDEEARPFFLWCSFPDPHHPYGAPEPWAGMYDPGDIPLPAARSDEEHALLPPFYRSILQGEVPKVSGLQGSPQISDDQLRRMIAMTYGMISFVDHEIGRVMKKLDESGLRENTIVVFMSDHGDMMGDHGMLRKGPFHFEGLLRIPFIWNAPGRFAEGLRTTGLASQIDFAPTILDLCGVPVPEGRIPAMPVAPLQGEAWPGRSLREQLEGMRPAINEAVLVENDEDYLGVKVRTLVTERYKLTMYPGQPYGELFDLAIDPLELNNLWSHPEHRPLRDELKLQLLDRYMLQDSNLPRRMTHA